MAAPLAPGDRAEIEGLVRRLEAAWNALDGAAFAAPFAADADFVNVLGEHFRGRPAIAAGHAGIFGSVYAGSVNAYTVEAVRLVRPDVVLAHVHSRLDVPRGPLAGQHEARFSLLCTREPAGWEIAAFHNTLRAAAPR